MEPIHHMKGVDGIIDVYDDKVVITPKGQLGLLNKGLKGSKTIPFSSIMAIQFKKAGFFSGYLQFTIPGGNENRNGLKDALKDENSFVFRGNNEEAENIKNFIEEKNRKAKESRALSKVFTPLPSESTSLSDEISKLSDLKYQGILTEEEFQEAKKKLLT